MNAYKTTLLIIVSLVFMTACKNEVKPEIKTIETDVTNIASNDQDLNAVYAKAEFGIEGMTCAIGCAKTIEKKIAKMDGVTFAKVDFARQIAMVEYDQAKVTPASLEATVTNASPLYKVKEMKKVEAFTKQ
jgi:Cu+-exporting ATPase